jgi:hypothetical protein
MEVGDRTAGSAQRLAEAQTALEENTKELKIAWEHTKANTAALLATTASLISKLPIMAGGPSLGQIFKVLNQIAENTNPKTPTVPMTTMLDKLAKEAADAKQRNDPRFRRLELPLT